MRSPRRAMCGSVLGLEAVVLALSSIVLITISRLPASAGLGTGLGLAAAAVLVAGLLRYEWAYFAGFAMQLAAIAVGVVAPAMFVLGIVFGALYTTAYLLGRKIEREQAARAGSPPDAGG
ncbi:MAG TPA: DUF4233 domain-containing protein [Nocardioidaceae bacterium]|nr:DUF4233 domain-containing protein [Nocardioidaceae bacterium]